jgi:hypothetical protein
VVTGAQLEFFFTITLLFATSIFGVVYTNPPLDSVAITPHPLNQPCKRRCNIAICSIFQDEAIYLKEWIEYHNLIGVDHFYLYNNRSSDNYLEILTPYIKSGAVELFDYPYPSFPPSAQTYVYNHALSLSRGQNVWLAIIDTDEFINPVLTENLYEALSAYGYAGLTLYWQMFGTSGVERIEEGELLTEKLLLKAPKNSSLNSLVKSIVRPEYVKCIADPHIAEYHPGFFAVCPNGAKFSHTPGYTELPIVPIRLNHYWFRTEEFLEKVKKPRREKYEGGWRSDAEWQEMKDFAHQEYDDSMLRFSDRLR